MSREYLPEDIYDQWLEEEREIASSLDPVAQNCEYKHFKSNSKGRGRKRRNPEDIEFLGYNQKFHMINEDDRFSGIDVIADEILEGTIPPGVDPVEELIRRARNL